LARRAHDPRLLAIGRAAGGEDVFTLSGLQNVSHGDRAFLSGYLQIDDHLMVRIVARCPQAALAGHVKRCGATRCCCGLAELCVDAGSAQTAPSTSSRAAPPVERTPVPSTWIG